MPVTFHLHLPSGVIFHLHLVFRCYISFTFTHNCHISVSFALIIPGCVLLSPGSLRLVSMKYCMLAYSTIFSVLSVVTVSLISLVVWHSVKLFFELLSTDSLFLNEICLTQLYIVLNRLHTGHSYLTQSFILRQEEAPVCVACGAVITVKHILIECADLLEIRRKYLWRKISVFTLRNVIPEKNFDFLQEIGVFYKIWSVLGKCVCEVFLNSCVKCLCGTFYNLFNE